MAPEETRLLKVWIDGTRSLDPASDGVTFSSSDDNIATVDENGLITAVAAGNVVITSTLGDSSATTSVAIQ